MKRLITLIFIFASITAFGQSVTRQLTFNSKISEGNNPDSLGFTGPGLQPGYFYKAAYIRTHFGGADSLYFNTTMIGAATFLNPLGVNMDTIGYLKADWYIRNNAHIFKADSMQVLNAPVNPNGVLRKKDSLIFRSFDNSLSKAQIQTGLNLKANLASPNLTGTPTTPTASTADNSTKIASTAFVHNVVDALPAATNIYTADGSLPAGATRTLTTNGGILNLGAEDANVTINNSSPSVTVTGGFGVVFNLIHGNSYWETKPDYVHVRGIYLDEGGAIVARDSTTSRGIVYPDDYEVNFVDNSLVTKHWVTSNFGAALGFTPENVANKATSFGTLNNTLYPTTQAVATYVAAQIPTTPSLQSVATVGNSYTGQIQAQSLAATGTAGAGYDDLISQSASPTSTTGHIKIYSDSLNRLSWKNSTYRRTIQVPYPSDYTIRMPYLVTGTTLEDSTHASATYGTITNLALKANIASPTFTGTVTIPNGGVFGTPTSMTATNVTGLPLTTGVTGVLPYANGGTNASTSWTQGSVIFGGASAYSQDNSNFFYDGTNHRLGLITAAPTHSLTLGTGGNVAIYNTSDQTTNYERLAMSWSGNVFSFVTQAGGSGTGRNFTIGTPNRQMLMVEAANTSTGFYQFATGTSLANAVGTTYQGTWNPSSGASKIVEIAPTINETSTSGYTALWITPFEQAVGSGSTFLIDAGTNSSGSGGGTHTSKFSVNSAGNTLVAGTLGVTSTSTLSGGITTTGGATPNFSVISGQSIGGSVSTSGILFGGASNVQYRAIFGGATSTTLAAGTSYGGLIVGSQPVTMTSTGTPAWLANAVINGLGTVTNATPITITNTASLYVGTQSAAGTNNYGIYSAGNIFSNTVIRLKGYTVATLPAGTIGDTAYVTDALTPAFGGTLVGGGAIVTKAFYNGSNWIAE